MEATTLATGPLAGLPHIDALIGRASDDEACLRDIREVLSRHNRLDRFGVMLLHQHFAVADDEIMVEECDEVNRVLRSTPRKRADLGQTKSIQTNWRLDSAEAVAACTQICTLDDDHQHIKESHL